MKKSLSIILSLAMVCTMSATAFAADSSTDLSAIADATIQVTQTTSESGAITNTFNNLDDFVNAVHTANPAISDYEIATYILDYTGQEFCFSNFHLYQRLHTKNIQKSKCIKFQHHR